MTSGSSPCPDSASESAHVSRRPQALASGGPGCRRPRGAPALRRPTLSRGWSGGDSSARRPAFSQGRPLLAAARSTVYRPSTQKLHFSIQQACCSTITLTLQFLNTSDLVTQHSAFEPTLPRSSRRASQPHFNFQDTVHNPAARPLAPALAEPQYPFESSIQTSPFLQAPQRPPALAHQATWRCRAPALVLASRRLASRRSSCTRATRGRRTLTARATLMLSTSYCDLAFTRSIQQPHTHQVIQLSKSSLGRVTSSESQWAATGPA